jgi:hypothetical protein
MRRKDPALVGKFSNKKMDLSFSMGHGETSRHF